ncbi:MAG TPA: hypothetical protein VLC52_03840, partial [Anaerolineae bacterium]|nr:hypothetical protein [Anaerolineae bacterium]
MPELVVTKMMPTWPLPTAATRACKLSRSVAVGGKVTTFTYDGNGTLVKKAVVGGQTTVYVGPHYEKNVTTGQETKYY